MQTLTKERPRGVREQSPFSISIERQRGDENEL